MPTAVVCGMDAPANLGEHPHEVVGRLNLRDIDDLVAVEHREVDRLTERVDDVVMYGLAIVPTRLVLARQAHQPRAERVLP